MTKENQKKKDEEKPAEKPKEDVKIFKAKSMTDGDTSEVVSFAVP